MKKRVFPVLAAFLMAFFVSATAGAGYAYGKSDTPWKQMQKVLYKQGVDTSGMTVLTSIDKDVIQASVTGLKKALKVKKKADVALTDTMTAGDLICAFMNAKYGGKSGEKNEYPIVCYSDWELDYFDFIDEYPESGYNSEMEAKGNCLSSKYTMVSNLIFCGLS